MSDSHCSVFVIPGLMHLLFFVMFTEYIRRAVFKDTLALGNLAPMLKLQLAGEKIKTVSSLGAT